MVGQGVLPECLLDAEITSVLAIGRSPLGQRHRILREIVRHSVGYTTQTTGKRPLSPQLRCRSFWNSLFWRAWRRIFFRRACAQYRRQPALFLMAVFLTECISEGFVVRWAPTWGVWRRSLFFICGPITTSCDVNAH